MQTRTTATQRDTKDLLPCAQIMGLKNITKAIIYNVSGRVESDILYTDLAITFVKKKNWIISEH